MLLSSPDSLAYKVFLLVRVQLCFTFIIATIFIYKVFLLFIKRQKTNYVEPNMYTFVVVYKVVKIRKQTKQAYIINLKKKKIYIADGNKGFKDTFKKYISHTL